MSAKLRVDLLRAAAAYLAWLECEKGEFTIDVVSSDGQLHHIPCRVWPETTSVPDEPGTPDVPGGRITSPLETKILTACDAVDYRSSETLAAEVGTRCGEGFKAILTNLVDAGLLEAVAGRGYRRVCGPDPA